MDWSIQEIAKLAGTTSRTLRHYDDIGLLAPTRIGSNGYRYYDERRARAPAAHHAAARAGPRAPRDRRGARPRGERPARAAQPPRVAAQEQDRLTRQIASVENTIGALEGGEQLMAENMFDGFDHTQYKEEVEERWGKDAYAKSDAWWRSHERRREGGLAAARHAARALTGSRRTSAASTRRATRRRRSRSGSSSGCAAFRARQAAAHPARRRSTSSASPRCTWPTSASARTTAAGPVPSSCATR